MIYCMTLKKTSQIKKKSYARYLARQTSTQAITGHLKTDPKTPTSQNCNFSFSASERLEPVCSGNTTMVLSPAVTTLCENSNEVFQDVAKLLLTYADNILR